MLIEEERTTRYAAQVARYDRSHARWLRHAGGEAQCAFEGAAAALLRPGMALLDAACGTGTVARRLLAGVDGSVELTLLDAEPGMLDLCSDLPARRLSGRIEAMPLPDDSFDLVTCAWGIETLDDPRPALGEFLRVARPGAAICIVFCAERPARSLWGEALRHSIEWRGLGRFLDGPLVMAAAATLGARDIRALHCTGPAAAVLFRAA